MQGEGGKRFRVGYLGRFVAEKDVPTLLRAVSRVGGSREWELFLVGGGPEENAYREMAVQLGIGERLHIESAVPHDEIPGILRTFDVLVLPSKTTARWKEQFGHVIIEAMACGVPVIGSSSGEIPQVIERAGMVFGEGDAEDLSQKLRLLHTQPSLREDLRLAGIRRVRERYTDTQIAANMITLYEIALGIHPLTPNTLEIDEF